MNSPREVKNLKYDKHLPLFKPSVQERWMGPSSIHDSFYSDETEDIDMDHEEEGCEGGEGGEEEHTYPGHERPWTFSLAAIWLRRAGNAIVNIISGLRKRVSLWCSWPIDFFFVFLARSRTF